MFRGTSRGRDFHTDAIVSQREPPRAIPSMKKKLMPTIGDGAAVGGLRFRRSIQIHMDRLRLRRPLVPPGLSPILLLLSHFSLATRLRQMPLVCLKSVLHDLLDFVTAETATSSSHDVFYITQTRETMSPIQLTWRSIA